MMQEKQRIMVTGGAGFIGSELVRQLILEGHFVHIVDNLINGKKENLSELSTEKYRLHILDIRDEQGMEELLKEVDMIYHLACLGVRNSLHNPYENHQVNAEATLKLLLLSRKHHLKRFIYVSSSEIYGTAREVPMKETHPPFPHTVYGASKLAGDCYSRALFDSYKFPTVVVRPFNAFGPRCHHEGDSGEVVPKFILRAMAGLPLIIFGDGQQTRDFTYVSDIAKGILLAGFSKEAVGQTINLGSGKEITINHLAQLIGEVLNQPIHIQYDQPRPGDVLRLYADASLSQDLLKFQPTLSLKEGLSKLHQWYLSHALSPEQLLKSEIIHNWKS